MKQSLLFNKYLSEITPEEQERYEKRIVDFDTDKFYLGLSDEEKEYFHTYLKYGYEAAKSLFPDIDFWCPHDIKHCPGCKKIRCTSCSACGCGSCYTCGYRWCCNPIRMEDLPKITFDTSKYRTIPNPLGENYPSGVELIVQEIGTGIVYPRMNETPITAPTG